MVSWAGLAGFGESAIGGYQNADTWLAQRQQREMQAAAAKAYGEAMMKMSQPQPWRVPMANDYTPPPPQMNLPNFMQAMPKGIDPAAAGMAVDRFAPVMRQQNMDEYRDSQIRLGQERNQQGAQRIELAQARIDARDLQNDVANKFRERALQIQAQGLEQRNPQAARAFQATQSKFIRANERVTSLMRALSDADRNLAMGIRRDVYDARQMELGAALKAAQAELEAVSQELDQYDASGSGLPQPATAPKPQAQPVAPTAAPPPAMPSPAGPPMGRPVPPGAVQMLRSNPQMAPAFDAKYGPGASKQYLQPAAPQGGMPVSPGPQGGPLAPWRSPRDAEKYNSARATDAAAAADPINQRVAQREQQAMAAAQSARDPGVGYPAGAYPDDPAPIDANEAVPMRTPEQLRAALAARGVQGVDQLTDEDLRVREAMLNLVDTTKPVVQLYKDAGAKAKEIRGKLGAPTAQRSSNPYAGMTIEQLTGEMKKLAAREFAARTDADKAAVKRDMDLLFKASAESARRKQQGS